MYMLANCTYYCTTASCALRVAYFNDRSCCAFLQNFFVCARQLPLWTITFALLAQGLDSNATLGNVAMSYRYILPLALQANVIADL